MAGRVSHPPADPTWRVELADEAQTIALAQEVAGWIKPGDLIALSGDIGAGKTPSRAP